MKIYFSTVFKATLRAAFLPVLVVVLGLAPYLSSLSAEGLLPLPTTKTQEDKKEKTGEDAKDDKKERIFPNVDTHKTDEKNQSIFTKAQNRILRFKFDRGDILEVKKYADQIITFDKDKIKRHVFNLMTLENTGRDEFNGYLFRGNFLSSFRYEEKKDIPFEEEESYESRFYIDPRGVFRVEDKYYMPNLRSLPTFPELNDPALKTLKPNMTWNAEGVEVLNFENQLIPVKFNVAYEYLGVERLETKDGVKIFHRISATYNYNQKFSQLKDAKSPKQAMGMATHTILWDQALSIPYFSREDYSLVMHLNDGSYREFNIKSRSFYRKIKKLNNEEVLKKGDGINEQLKSFVDEDKVSIRQTQQGTIVQLQDVLFDVNSSVLSKTTSQVLDKLIQSLKDYPNSRLKITGHTDNSGSEELNKKLSEERARAVVQYLTRNTKIPVENFSFIGKGEKEPIADNTTAEGRQKNRRVDILILHD